MDTGNQPPGEPELAARIKKLTGDEARYVLYWLATGSDAMCIQLAEALDAADRRRARLAEGGTS
jgi:hypothetical protein